MRIVVHTGTEEAMKESHRIQSQLEMPQDGKLIHCENRKELLDILGFCGPENAAGQGSQQEAAPEIPETKTAYPERDDCNID
jgi:hypothetical protein